jgi:threonine/homoserine efflux transporter RhtA
MLNMLINEMEMLSFVGTLFALHEGIIFHSYILQFPIV